jgi:hypothetical protein
MVPLGLAFACFCVTNWPVDADLFTVRALPVPDPTRSVVVFEGQRAAAALLTKRPLDAERLTVRPMVGLLLVSWAVALLLVTCAGSWWSR